MYKMQHVILKVYSFLFAFFKEDLKGPQKDTLSKIFIYF